MSRKYPAPADVARVCDALLKSGPAPQTARAIALTTGLPVHRVAAVLGHVRDPQAPGVAEGLSARFAELKKRDRARLDAMMRYAEGTTCRAQTIARYFGDDAPASCGLCDQCA